MDTYERGMQVRRQVLGDDHVDRAVAGTKSIDADFQRWITETAWAGAWDRPGLDRRTKSLITIAILAGLGHEELGLHLKAAANTGATPNDIAEGLSHVAVNAGVPAANSAFNMAKRLYDSPRGET